MPSATLWAHGQSALLLLALACLLPGPARRPAWLVPPALALAWLPLGGLDLTAYLYAYSGALGVPTLVLVADWVLRRLGAHPGLPAPERRALWRGAALASLALYPMTLGLGPFDPYSLGFTGPWLPVCTGLVALLAWWHGLRGPALALLAALWAWALALGESSNLWDYLLDGWLALASLLRVLSAGGGLFSRFLGRRVAMYQNSHTDKRL